MKISSAYSTQNVLFPPLPRLLGRRGIFLKSFPKNVRFFLSQYIATRREEIFLKTVRFPPLPRLPGRREKFSKKFVEIRISDAFGYIAIRKGQNFLKIVRLSPLPQLLDRTAIFFRQTSEKYLLGLHSCQKEENKPFGKE